MLTRALKFNLNRQVLAQTQHNATWAIVEFQELAARAPNGCFPQGYFTVAPPNPWQQARGIQKVYSYHSPGPMSNHFDVLHVAAVPRPTSQTAEHAQAFGPYWTWPTKYAQETAVYEEPAVDAESFLEAFKAALQPARPSRPAPAAKPMLTMLPSNASTVAMGPQAVTYVTPTRLAAASSASSQGNRVASSASNYAPNFRPLAEEEATFKPLVAEPDEDDDTPVIRRQAKRTIMEDDNDDDDDDDDDDEEECIDMDATPPKSASRQESSASDASSDLLDGSSNSAFTSPKSVAFTSPSILRTKKAQVNKKLQFSPAADQEEPQAAFNVKSLFEDEAEVAKPKKTLRLRKTKSVKSTDEPTATKKSRVKKAKTAANQLPVLDLRTDDVIDICDVSDDEATL